jgi:1,4-alpha-glucan branching enzyme/maltooligosyltrehalose trehalohydrolase
MPFGAELDDGGRVRFQLWAPSARSVALRLEAPGPEHEIPMGAEAEGWFRTEVSDAGPGFRYRFRIDEDFLVPDPASRSQPEGVHGASEVIDPCAFHWQDAAWHGRAWEEAVLYELHVGTFTARGDFAGVAERLDHLVDLGVTAVELMPVAECPGEFNWGYDGVYPFAPEQCYGRPEDFKALVEAAHARGLMLLLDVVYNHFGPEGNYLPRYAEPFFTKRRRTPWGAAIDFEGEHSRTVRDFFIHNALYWLEEYNLDGLRLDAVHAIHDASRPDILTELAEAVDERLEHRQVHLILENDRNEARRLERDAQGATRLFSAQWNDDIHHALHVLLTGERAGYYVDYADHPIRHLGRCLAAGFAYQGDSSGFRNGAPRGEPSAHLPPAAFVSFLQNHDQVGNRAFGERIVSLADPEAVRAALAVLLLAPSPPLLFMGEEWGCEQPFPFFGHFGRTLAARVREGRRQEFARFPEFRDEAARERIPDPGARETFESAALRWDDLGLPRHRKWLAYYRRLLETRHREITPRLAAAPGRAAEFAEIGEAGLQGSWRLRDGVCLHLRAQLAPEPCTEVPAPSGGRLLFATHDALPQLLEHGEMPAWSAAWHLEDPSSTEGR